METVPVSGDRVDVRAYVVAGPWTSFLVAVLFLLLFPLLPLGAELSFTGEITVASLSLVTATYATSLAMSSRSLAVWAIGLMIGIIFSSLYGWSMALSNAAVGPAYPLVPGVAASHAKVWASAGMLAFVFAMHLWERYVRHVKGEELFPEFLKQ